MTEKKTNQEVAESIMDDGLGYCIQYGFSADSIEDEALANMWAEAYGILMEISSYLRKQVPELDDYV